MMIRDGASVEWLGAGNDDDQRQQTGVHLSTRRCRQLCRRCRSSTWSAVHFIHHYLCHQGGGYVIVQSCHSFCHSVNRITDERGNRRQPNLTSTGKIQEVVDWWWSGYRRSLFHFIHHWGISDFPTFVSIFSVFSIFTQSTADLYHSWRNDWRRRDHASTMWERIFDGYPDPD